MQLLLKMLDGGTMAVEVALEGALMVLWRLAFAS
jgi:hypothetical protein